MNRQLLPHRLEATVKGRFLGQETDQAGYIVAVESYVGSVPTFTWMACSGHLFCYLPPHAFGTRSLGESVDFECEDSRLELSDLALEGGGRGRVGSLELVWKRYVVTADWPRANHLAHLVWAQDGLCWIRNSRFQVGGETFERPAWKKSRQVWRLPIGVACPDESVAQALRT